MNKIWLILKYEFLTIVRSRSFLLTLILVPLVSMLVLVVVGILRERNQGPELTDIFSPTPEVTIQGVVDQSGLVKTIPDAMQQDLVLMESQDSAATALENGEIAAYFVISADYLGTGLIEYHRSDFNPIGGFEQSGIINSLLRANLIEDEDLLERVQNPINMKVVSLTNEPQRDPDNALTFFVPYGVTFLFYIFIMGSASLMLSNVTSEKQNRVMEILLTSMTPTQMFTGKIIALGLVGLLQTVVWSGAGLIMLRMSGQTFALPAEFQLPVSILLWGIVFFVLGYAIYAGLMAGVGALIPNLRESSQVTFVVILPMIIPLMLITLLIEKPNSVASLILSLFPLTSPISMMTRLAAIPVPLWQLLLAALLQALTAWLIIRSVAGMFRAQNLLSGQTFSLKLFFRALFGRA